MVIRMTVIGTNGALCTSVALTFLEYVTELQNTENKIRLYLSSGE
jgi:hypothetical protein